jgi:SNW domain-containing protein 1
MQFPLITPYLETHPNESEFICRFVPDKEFSGTDRATAGRSGPVQFEKDEDDPFGLDQFLATAKGASNKRSSDEHNKRDRGGESSSKRRKDY